MNTQEELLTAYYTGRNSVWGGYTREFSDANLRKAYFEGRRDAQAEIRLDRDTEWDED